MQLFISHSQVAVFDPSLERPLNFWTKGHVAQGFSWRPGSVSFATLSEGGRYDVEVIVESKSSPIADAVVRAIEVPFGVPARGAVEIGSVAGGQEISLPPGPCGLRFEEFPGQRVRLVFSIGKAVDFSVLRVDPGLKPVLPLLRSAEPA
jgi:hypothetical protein